jgi:lipid A ethanolaminephosphotransferase
MRTRLVSTAPALAFGAAVFLVLVANRPFWSQLLRVAPVDSLQGASFVAATFMILVALLNLTFLTLAFRWVLKPVLVAVLLVSALCAHFMSAYGVVIDRELVQSALQTDVLEVRDLFSGSFFVDLLALWILPSVLVVRAPLRFAPLRREILGRLIAGGASLALCAVLGALEFKQLALVGREHGELRQLLNPVGPLQVTIRSALDAVAGPARPLVRIGLDARRAVPAAHRGRSLVVLVVGETARAANFSLNGYARETNPRLGRRPVVSFTRVRSCGTATATSLPCMFSPGGRAAYDGSGLAHQEGLLDVLERAGVQVLWRDNNSGCKHVCDRVEIHTRRELAVPAACSGGECLDEILLSGLQGVIDGLGGDALIVLHQQGSHGPAYYRRSPQALKKFAPECSGANLANCSREAIVNAYDNSILYTDWFLDRLIELLAVNSQRFRTALLYVSDHGESLGEKGIYLHGLPWLIAPDEQTRVPMILWLPEPTRTSLGIDGACIERRRHEPLSHDALFHSLLGLFDVSTALYRPELDLLAACRDRASMASGARAAGAG